VNRSKVFSVTEVTRQIKEALETIFPPVWIEGELSDFRTAASGHSYFTLKDDLTQISAVMFRREADRLPFLPEDGMQVMLFGRITVYEARGNYQIIVEDMEPRGLGSIREALEKLKNALQDEGLFHEGKKRLLPAHPGTVGVVTSPTGAAIQDIIKVITERDAPVNVLLSPALVQGRDAPASIFSALELLAGREEVDVVIVGRGGGSFEDLMAFSDEAVVRAIAEYPIPIISAVGHEIDISLSDLAADVRAATPSAAAEMVAHGREETFRQLDYLSDRLLSSASYLLESTASGLKNIGSRLIHPKYLLEQGRMRVDDLSFRLGSLMRSKFEIILADVRRLGGLLAALGPQSVLDRGYALVIKGDGTLVRTSNQVELGEGLDVRLAKTSIGVKVTRNEE